MEKKIIIEIDPSAGFCFGVEKAIKTAEQNLNDGREVYGLGDMVHNDIEISRLTKLGLKTITHDDLESIRSGKLIFRAHGEPPSTYKRAEELNIDVIDATCPIVLKLQKKISKRSKELNREKEQIVFFGKKGHPETTAMMGHVNHQAVLITDPDELSAIDKKKSIFLYSQTTMDPEEFYRLEANIRKICDISEITTIESSCTICGQMKKRKPELKHFSRTHDLIIFVSGKKSSNGAMLYNFCKTNNQNSFWIHSLADIKTEWTDFKGTIGITGSTSTPLWQLQEVKDYLESLMKD